MANNYIGLSGNQISIGGNAEDNYSINELRGESNLDSVVSNQPNSSIRDLHDWFWSNAHITNSNATATNQTDIRFSEFYKAQILEANYTGRDESGDGWYGFTNNAYVHLSINPDCLVRDESGDYAVNFMALKGGQNTGSGESVTGDTDNIPNGTWSLSGTDGIEGSWTTALNTGSIGTVYGPTSVGGGGHHQQGYDVVNAYVADYNTGAWMMRKIQIDDSSSAWNSSSNRHTDFSNAQVTDNLGTSFRSADTGYKGVSGGALNPPGWALGTLSGEWTE